ncbi:hypothetical protein CAEBREN_16311 [Caenorhabditis brenneri]|uniref:Uncharacterized protein n=1 Tax=Caenorhabditis brenneri TaxID=135651 RepID=G0MA47_CAEBE|nr:hypothetical protein CAEBREN_16311 [Caenorhabditis brenneri]
MDYQDWEQFYKKVDSYVDEFYKHLDNCEDVKITIEKGSEKDTYAIKIELKRPTKEESHEFRRATYMEVPGPLKKWNSERVLRKTENSKPTLKIPVAIPLIFFNSKFLIAIFNYCLYGKKDFDQVLLLRKFLTSQLSGTCLFLDPNQFLIIFNQCLKFDLPRLKSDGEPLELDIKFEIDKQEDYAPVLDHDFLNSLKKKEEPIEVSGQESDDEELTSLKNNYEEEIAAAARIEKPVSLNENLSKEEFPPAPRTIELEDEDDENSESQKKFRDYLEEQKQKFRAELEAIREERRKKRMAHEAELKDLRRQQKQRFAALMSCIFLKQRFEEKESDWSSWIENSLKQLIVKIVRKFGDFQDFTKNFSNFKKLYKEDPEDVISEIGDLNSAIATLLFDLETVFNKLAKVDQDFESVLFIRIIQKRICIVANNLNELFVLLEEISYTNDWYQYLEQKMTEIQPSQIPTTSELKRICKNINKMEYENLQFPKWENKSHVIIKEVDEEDDEQVGIETVNIEVEDDEIGDGVLEDDICDNQIVNLRFDGEISEVDTTDNDKDSQYISTTHFGYKEYETNVSNSFAETKPESYQPERFNEPQNGTDTLEVLGRPCHSSKFDTSTLGTDYTGDEVTRLKQNYTIGPETSFTKSCAIDNGSSSVNQSDLPTASLNHENDKDGSKQNEWLAENSVKTNNSEQAALENNGFFAKLKFLKHTKTSTANSFAQPDHAAEILADGHDKEELNFENNGHTTDYEVSKSMEPVSQNKLSIVVPPGCGSVSPKLDYTPKSESSNPCDNVSIENLEELNQESPDEPVSSRTRSASRSEAVKNSSDDIRRRSELQLNGTYRNYQVYDDSGTRQRSYSSRRFRDVVSEMTEILLVKRNRDDKMMFFYEEYY